MTTASRTRSALPYDIQVRVFRRDRWLCRWCHRPVVFAAALKFLDELARERGHDGLLAYHDPRWRRDRAPLLAHLAAVVAIIRETTAPLGGLPVRGHVFFLG